MTLIRRIGLANGSRYGFAGDMTRSSTRPDSEVIKPGDEYTYCRHDPDARWTPVRENLCTRTKVGMTVAEVKRIFRSDLSGGHFTQDQIDRRVDGYAVRSTHK